MITASKLRFLGIGLLLLPLVSMAVPPKSEIPPKPAASSEPVTSTVTPVEAVPTVNEISKDSWLEQVRLSAAVPICKSFVEDEAIAAQMKTNSISYEKCVSLIPGIAEKCEKKYDAGMPLSINDEGAEKWGKLIGECIGNDFATNYLYVETKEKPTL